MLIRRSSIALIASLAALVLLAACASPGPLQRMQSRLAQVESVAGEPVDNFHFWTLYRWEPLGREHVAVWTRIDTAWLIEVRPPCSGLEFTQSIGLTATQNRVYARFDKLVFEQQSCFIASIRPIDTKALKALKAAAATASP